jgi:hypothetical protein
VPYTGFAYDIPVLKGVKVKHGEFEQGGLALVMSNSKLAGNIVEQWLAHCAGKRTVLFAVNIAHSLDLVQRFRAAGVAAEHVDGDDADRGARGRLRRLSTGETHVVCNVNVLTEGWDCPELEVVILARPTLSVGFYMQMVGRGLRPAHGQDHLPDPRPRRLHPAPRRPRPERDYSLTADMRKPKGLDVARPAPLHPLLRALRGDAARLPAVRRGARCPPRVVKEVEGVAIPIEQLANEAARRKAYLDEQLRVAEATGKKRGDGRRIGTRSGSGSGRRRTSGRAGCARSTARSSRSSEATREAPRRGRGVTRCRTTSRCRGPRHHGPGAVSRRHPQPARHRLFDPEGVRRLGAPSSAARRAPDVRLFRNEVGRAVDPRTGATSPSDSASAAPTWSASSCPAAASSRSR